MYSKVMSKKLSKNIKTVLDILHDEVRGSVEAALKKMGDNYSMTWVYKSPRKGVLFPKTGKNIKKEMRQSYPIKGREYDIKNIAEGDGVVMVELIESYPDPKTKKIYRTPLVLVLEMDKGKITSGRHYCDPNLSYLHLSKSQVARAHEGKKSKMVIKQ